MDILCLGSSRGTSTSTTSPTTSPANSTITNTNLNFQSQTEKSKSTRNKDEAFFGSVATEVICRSRFPTVLTRYDERNFESVLSAEDRRMVREILAGKW